MAALLAVGVTLLYSPIDFPIAFFKKKDFIYFWRAIEGEREKHWCVRKKHRSVVYCTCPSWGLACNPGMCPDWELNQRPFTLWDNAQLTEPRQSGPITFECYVLKALQVHSVTFFLYYLQSLPNCLGELNCLDAVHLSTT